MPESRGPRKPVGEILLAKGLITERQLEEALQIQQQRRSKKLGWILVDLGFVSSEQVLQAVRDQQRASWSVTRPPESEATDTAEG